MSGSWEYFTWGEASEPTWNQLGVDGWELVAIERRERVGNDPRGPELLAYFKRPLKLQW